MNEEQRPWLKNYPKDIPANIDPDAYPNVVAAIEDAFEKYRWKPAYQSMGKILTYDELDKKSRAFAAYLQSRGLEAGDRIALMMPNMLQYPIAMYGALRAGLVLVNTNPLYTPREMKHQFCDSGAKAIIIAENFAYNLEQILPETPIKTVIVTSIGEMLGFKGKIVNVVVRYVKKLVPKYRLENTVTVTHAIKQGEKFTIKPFDSKPDDTIILQYTGGTTGVAKGAMLTNRNLIANMMQMKGVMFSVLQEGNEVSLTALPMYHVFAFTVNAMGLFSGGIKNVLITNPRDIKNLIKEWKEHPVSVFIGVNTLFNGLLNHEDFKSCDFSTLKITVAGGMALQNAVAQRWEDVTKCYLAQGYGLTESSPVASVNPIDGTGKLGTIGLPIPTTDMRVVDDAGKALGIEEVGEIQIKGPQVMKGYYNRPEETAQVLTTDGWLQTGDIGKMDADGYFSIVDRKKDMILVSGFNVYPNEVEEVLSMNVKILESCAIGVPDEKTGEAVKVFVVKKDATLTKEEVIEHCKQNMTAYKVPKQVEFKDDLPKTNVGKILRRELRDK